MVFPRPHRAPPVLMMLATRRAHSQQTALEAAADALEPVPDGTRLTLSNEAPMRGWMKPFQPLLRRSVQGMFERDLARLKSLIEVAPVA